MLNWTLKTRRGRLDPKRVSSVWARFGSYVQPHRFRLLMAFFAAVGTIAMQIASPWPIKIIFDRVLSDTMSPSWLTEALSFVASSPQTVLAWVCGAILLIGTRLGVCRG